MSKAEWFLRVAIVACCLLAVPPVVAGSTFTFGYEGNTFTTADAPFTTGDRITASATFASIAAGTQVATSWGITFSAASGDITITDSTPGAFLADNLFEFDGTGAIVRWSLAAYSDFLAGPALEIINTRGGGAQPAERISGLSLG